MRRQMKGTQSMKLYKEWKELWQNSEKNLLVRSEFFGIL